MRKELVKIESLTREFKPEAIKALDNVNLVVEEGEFLALTGPSGSGKSALLKIVGGVDRPTSGRVLVDGVAINELGDGALAAWRHRNVGFIFRTIDLVPVLTVRENVALPLLLSKLSRQQKRARVDTVLELVGLAEHKDSSPRKLSGEQQQRAAIARALVMEPPLILADEPTGELNAQATEEILILLGQLHSDWGKTLILATHDEGVARYAQTISRLNKGVSVEAETLGVGRVYGVPEFS
jgi:putative ABC transport system ATP-binding protein